MQSIAPGPIVESAVTEVLRVQFGLDAEPVSEPSHVIEGYASHLSGTVQLFGSRVQGSLSLAMPDALANKLVALMVGGSEDDDIAAEDKADVAGEICNMLAGKIGQALSKSGYSNDLSVPEVHQGLGDWSTTLLDNAEFNGVWHCAGLPLVLNLALRLES
jgi:CheY-specific phosphatase CheX